MRFFLFPEETESQDLVLLRDNMKIIRHWKVAACLLFALTYVSCDTDRRYPPKLESEKSFTPPTQEQKLWALATTAVLTESNRRRHDLLGGCERTPEEPLSRSSNTGQL